MEEKLIKYKSMTGDEVQLSPDIIRKYLVSGNGDITDQEIRMYIQLCRYQKLNPFLREVYLIKYSNKNPATMVTGKETFLKRAQRNKKYRGHETGISVDGKIAWAKIYHEDYDKPIYCEVDYKEYVGQKDEYINGKPTGVKIPNRMWAEKPRTMLKKCALVTALRETFTEDFGGLYSQEEVNIIEEALPLKEVTPENTEPKPNKLLKVKTGIVKISKHKRKDNEGKYCFVYKILGEGNILYHLSDENLATLAKSAHESDCRIEITHKDNEENTIQDITLIEP